MPFFDSTFFSTRNILRRDNGGLWNTQTRAGSFVTKQTGYVVTNWAPLPVMIKESFGFVPAFVEGFCVLSMNTAWENFFASTSSTIPLLRKKNPRGKNLPVFFATGVFIPDLFFCKIACERCERRTRHLRPISNTSKVPSSDIITKRKRRKKGNFLEQI